MLFRVASGRDGPPRVERRGMDCRFDPEVPAPVEVFRERGTLGPGAAD